MKKMIVFGILVSSFAMAQEMATKIEVHKENSQPQFGVQYSQEPDSLFFVTASVWGPDLTAKGPLTSVSYRYYDTKTASYISEWKVSDQRTSPVFYPGAYAFQVVEEKELALKVLRTLHTLRLVLKVNAESKPMTRFISIEDLCKTNPERFINIATDETGCGARNEVLRTR